MEFVTQVHFSKKGPTRIRTGVVRIKTESDNHYTIGPELTGRSENHDRIRHPCISPKSIFNEKTSNFDCCYETLCWNKNPLSSIN